jgi:protein-disulfide isomerase
MIWQIGLGCLVILAVAVAVVIAAQRQPPAATAALTPVADVRVSPSLGPATAPVKIVEYGDFGCSTCRSWHQSGTLAALRLKYGDHIQFIWRDFPVITAQ